MTLTATVVGILISVPIGIGAARNLVARPVYLVCRSIIAVSRSLQEIIIAIFLVAMFGFGPFAGFITLAFAPSVFWPSCSPTTSRRSTPVRPRPYAPPAPAGGNWSTTPSSPR